MRPPLNTATTGEADGKSPVSGGCGIDRADVAKTVLSSASHDADALKDGPPLPREHPEL